MLVLEALNTFYMTFVKESNVRYSVSQCSSNQDVGKFYVLILVFLLRRFVKGKYGNTDSRYAKFPWCKHTSMDLTCLSLP